MINDILRASIVDDLALRLPPQQLDRKTYEAVNEVLTRLGGTWNRKAKAHLFEDDPRGRLEDYLATGALPPKNPFAFFATPDAIARHIVRMADIQSDDRVLEPSAGKGAIAQVLRDTGVAFLDCVEIDPARAQTLTAMEFNVVASDFLTYNPDYFYERIVMNPPFAIAGDPLTYMAHVVHAFNLLSHDGKLVAIAPPSFTYRTDKRSTAFRAMVERHGGWEPLPSESFRESGTDVQTVVLWLVAQ